MSERETKIIETPIKKYKVELNTYITGFEKREISNAFLQNTKFQIDGESVKTQEMTADLANKAQDKTIKIVVVSINGNKEDVVNTIGNLPSLDYEFVMTEINNVTSGIDFLKKTKTS